MSRIWTPEQIAAIDTLDRDVCVAAGAGAGKTGVLVERVVRTVRRSAAEEVPPEQRAGIDQMLIITFTDKAAREMKERLVEAFTRYEMQEERRKVEVAYISTVHTFCSRLLKENPFEAGVSPAFTVLAETEATTLERTCFERAVEAAFATSDEETIELVAGVQDEGAFRRGTGDGIAGLAAALARLTARLRSAGVRLEEARAHWAAGLDITAARSLDPVRVLLGPVMAELAACRATLAALRLVGGSVRDTLLNALANDADALSELEADCGADRLCACAAAVKRVADQLKGLARRLRGAEGADPDLQAAVGRLRDALSQAAALHDAALDNERDAAVLCHRMWGLAISTWAEYAQAKRDAGVLDITDLQGEAVRLLEESPGVLQRYRKRFRYILVDEFQDTDPLQMRLVSLLHGERGGGGTAYANSLFIVGDAQQAIYGFRNADPTIFREQARRFREEAAGRHVTLAGNFRSRPEIIRFVNEAFARIWSRGETIHAPSTHGGEHEPKDCATVECLLARATDRGSYVATEAAALAEHIRTMVHSERVRRTHRGDRRCGEPVHYGDVAILLRALTQIETYERVFSERGIPYFVVGGGRGYYARMEIRDVANLLKTLDTPLDDIAVASALRSPMAGVDSDTLLALADLARSRREETGGRLYPAIPLLLDADALPADQAAMLEGFYMMSERLRGDLDRVPVGQLLECALAETQYDARLLVRPNGRRRLANVRKLLQMAFAKPDEGVSGFVRRLADLTQLSEREGDAPTEEEASDVVRFVSVHKAKGLEFPVVYVADMSRRQAGGPPDTFLCDPATMALGSKIGDYASLAHRVLSQRRKDADIAESTRLLYVAMTRAREHLVLCGATQGRSQGDTWAEMVFPQAGITYPQEPETRIGLGGVAMRLLPMEMLAAGNLA